MRRNAAARPPDLPHHGGRIGIRLTAVLGGFASTLSFPVAAALVATVGWRDALLVIGAVLLLVVAPLHGWALCGSFPSPSGRGQGRDGGFEPHAASPSSGSGLQAAARTAGEGWAVEMPPALTPTLSRREREEERERESDTTMREALRTRSFWLLTITFTVYAFVFALLFGFGNGLVTILRGHVVPEYFGRGHVGRIGGAMVGITVFARAGAPLAAAWLLLVMSGYRELLLPLAAVGAAALATFAFARPSR